MGLDGAMPPVSSGEGTGLPGASRAFLMDTPWLVQAGSQPSQRTLLSRAVQGYLVRQEEWAVTLPAVLVTVSV